MPMPSKLSISSSRNVETNCRRFYRQWTNYEIASRLDKEPCHYRCAVLLACIGGDAVVVYDGLPFFLVQEDMNDIYTVLQFCIGETHEAYEAYVFNKRSQEQPERIDVYITTLRQLAKTCHYG